MNEMTVTRIRDAVILSKNGNTIIIDTSKLSNLKQLVSKIESGKITPPDIDGSPSVYTDEVKKLIAIEEQFIQENPIDIFDLLPVTKEGKFNKNSSILIADSECPKTFNGDYFSRRKLQLRLNWDYIRYEIEKCLPDKKSAMILQLDWFDGSKKQDPVFDKNGGTHAINKTRATYLKDYDIKPGYVYAEKSGTEYLVLGKMPLEIENFYVKERQASFYNGIQHRNGEYLRDLSIWFTYLRWTKKLQTRLTGAKDFNDFVKAMASEKEWYEKASRRDNPRKFVTEVCKVFDGSSYHEETIRTENYPYPASGTRPGEITFSQYYIR